MVAADQNLVRLAASSAIFTAMALWEVYQPIRQLTDSKPRRWLHNLSMVVLGSVVVRWILPMGAIGAASLAESRSWGLFNSGLASIKIPDIVVLVSSVAFLDLAIYLQHVAFHKVPFLWNVHLVHHTDIDVDVTTGNRFHPLEFLLSMLIKMGIVVLLGAPVSAVFVFELLLNGTSLFNHSNVRLPRTLERLLRLVVVTPDFHRIHHSIRPSETNSNFGFNSPWWDYLFRTYRAEPIDGHEEMELGLPIVKDPTVLTFSWLLSAPIRRMANRDHEPE